MPDHGHFAMSVALPQLRVRRRRPPSGRQVYRLLQLANVLGYIALSVTEATSGRPTGLLWLLVGIGWAYAYVLHHRLHQRQRRLEESQDAAPRPVSRGEWISLAFSVLVQVSIWPDLIGARF